MLHNRLGKMFWAGFTTTPKKWATCALSLLASPAAPCCYLPGAALGTELEKTLELDQEIRSC